MHNTKQIKELRVENFVSIVCIAIGSEDGFIMRACVFFVAYNKITKRK